MRTFTNDIDVLMKQYPRSFQEWADNPVIKFSIDRKQIVMPGDRIFIGKTTGTGERLGKDVEVFIEIIAVLSAESSNVHTNETNVKATAKRIEI